MLTGETISFEQLKRPVLTATSNRILIVASLHLLRFSADYDVCILHSLIPIQRDPFLCIYRKCSFEVHLRAALRTVEKRVPQSTGRRLAAQRTGCVHWGEPNSSLLCALGQSLSGQRLLPRFTCTARATASPVAAEPQTAWPTGHFTAVLIIGRPSSIFNERTSRMAPARKGKGP